jgi:hypothetical protein
MLTIQEMLETKTKSTKEEMYSSRSGGRTSKYIGFVRDSEKLNPGDEPNKYEQIPENVVNSIRDLIKNHLNTDEKPEFDVSREKMKDGNGKSKTVIDDGGKERELFTVWIYRRTEEDIQEYLEGKKKKEE